MIRDCIGYDNCKLMMDANQRWDVDQAIEFMLQLVQFKPTWIEEPTSPDDVLGHVRRPLQTRFNVIIGVRLAFSRAVLGFMLPPACGFRYTLLRGQCVSEEADWCL